MYSLRGGSSEARVKRGPGRPAPPRRPAGDGSTRARQRNVRIVTIGDADAQTTRPSLPTVACAGQVVADLFVPPLPALRRQASSSRQATCSAVSEVARRTPPQCSPLRRPDRALGDGRCRRSGRLGPPLPGRAGHRRVRRRDLLDAGDLPDGDPPRRRRGSPVHPFHRRKRRVPRGRRAPLRRQRPGARRQRLSSASRPADRRGRRPVRPSPAPAAPGPSRCRDPLGYRARHEKIRPLLPFVDCFTRTTTKARRARAKTTRCGRPRPCSAGAVVRLSSPGRARCDLRRPRPQRAGCCRCRSASSTAPGPATPSSRGYVYGLVQGWPWNGACASRPPSAHPSPEVRNEEHPVQP